MTKRPSRFTYALMAVTMTLGMALAWSALRAPSPERTRSRVREGRLLADFDAGRVHGVTIAQGNQSLLDLRLDSASSRWMKASADHGDSTSVYVDEIHVSIFLDTWTSVVPLRHVATLTEAREASAFGLDETAYTITLRATNGDVKFSLGSARAVDGSAYMRVGDEVYGVPASVAESTTQAIEAIQTK